MNDKLLDETGLHILHLLRADARLSYAEIGRRVHLSTPAVIERIRKMEDDGIITSYQAEIAPKALGYHVTVMLTLTTDPVHYTIVLDIVQETPEIVTCDHITGPNSFIMRVQAAAVSDIERIIGLFAQIGTTSTAMVMSRWVTTDPLLARLEQLREVDNE
ncbi:MAG: Lrp/AsnC family transcriptional regulator [Chloroflexota bacterium]